MPRFQITHCIDCFLGAMRQVYRMKKLSQVRLTNWCAIDWQHAPNLVAKCYKNLDNQWNPSDRLKCFADVKLQIEAAELAAAFNKHSPTPPKKIDIIACHVIEFFDRFGCPVFGCERFIDGHDEHGHSFVKHNSNKGYVDVEEHRQTPQAFSCFSFYVSHGDCMVVDVQGVNDLYTDPQIHTMNRRFGNADLGCKGMAYFFANFQRNALCDYLCLPIFEMSRKHKLRLSSKSVPCGENATTTVEHESTMSRSSKWRADGIMGLVADQHSTVQAQIKCLSIDPLDLEEVVDMLALAGNAAKAELNEAASNEAAAHEASGNEENTLQINLSNVHFELSLLHIQGEFSDETDEDGDTLPDIPSCIFHLCKACILGNTSAALALGRIKQGPLDEVTILTLYLQEYIKIDVETTKIFSSLASLRLQKKPIPMSVNDDDYVVNDGVINKSTTFAVGESVEVNYMAGSGGWFIATVVKVEDNFAVDSNIGDPAAGGAAADGDIATSVTSNQGSSNRCQQTITVRYEEGTEEKITSFDYIRKR